MGSKQNMHGPRLTKRTEISNLPFNHDFIFKARQTCTLFCFYTEVGALSRPSRNLPLRSRATLHVIGPVASLAPVVRVCFLGRFSQALRPPDASESPWSESPARRPRVA